MNGENALQPATDPSHGGSSNVLTLSELGSKKEWTLRLQPAHLELSDTSGTPPYVILREEMMRTATLSEGMQLFVLNRPLKANFKLTTDAARILADWIGRPVLAKFYLKRRYAWVLPIAVIWILGSLPAPGLEGRGGQPLDVIGLILAMTLVASWAFAKWRPHPALFLVDSIWFLLLAGRLFYDVLVKGHNKGWLVLAVFMFWMVITGLKHFRRFRGTTLHPQAP